MSVAASGGGMDGSDGGGDDRKRKRVHEEDIADELPSSTDDEDEEVDPRGLSTHYTGKSKSYKNLTVLNIKESKEVGKKEHHINKKRRLQIRKKIRQDALAAAAMAAQPADQAMDENAASNPPATAASQSESHDLTKTEAGGSIAPDSDQSMNEGGDDGDDDKDMVDATDDSKGAGGN